MRVLAVSAFFSLAALAYAQCQQPSSFKFQPTFEPSVKGNVIFNGLKKPRSIKFDSADPPNLLVVDVGRGVVALQPRDNCWEEKVVIENGDFNHGLEYNNGLLYVSTADVLLEYQYDPSSASVSGSPRTLVRNMGNTGHGTRTLLIQGDRMIITRGSEDNVDLGAQDLSTGRSQIRRFSLTGSVPDGGHDWMEGELLAWGVRNAVAIALSQDGSRLWEAENSADQLNYTVGDTVIDIHEDNPAEELNLIDLSNPSSLGAFYGYPNCYTVWNFTSDGAPSTFSTGDQFSIPVNGSRDDAWCADQANNVRPVLSFQAHSAPLDMKFFSAPDNRDFSINTNWNNQAFVSFHGSWDRTNPTGYGVIRIPWSDNAPAASTNSGNGYSFVVQAADLTKCRDECIRPVGLAFDSRGRMFVSSDTTGEIFVVQNVGAPDNSAMTLLGSRWSIALAMVSAIFVALF